MYGIITVNTWLFLAIPSAWIELDQNETKSIGWFRRPQKTGRCRNLSIRVQLSICINLAAETDLIEWWLNEFTLTGSVLIECWKNERHSREPYILIFVAAVW